MGEEFLININKIIKQPKVASVQMCDFNVLLHFGIRLGKIAKLLPFLLKTAVAAIHHTFCLLLRKEFCIFLFESVAN